MLVSGMVDETRLNVKCPSQNWKPKKTRSGILKRHGLSSDDEFSAVKFDIAFWSAHVGDHSTNQMESWLARFTFFIHQIHSLRPVPADRLSCKNLLVIHWTGQPNPWYQLITHAFTGFKNTSKTRPILYKQNGTTEHKVSVDACRKSTTCMMLRLLRISQTILILNSEPNRNHWTPSTTCKNTAIFVWIEKPMVYTIMYVHHIPMVANKIK